MTIIGRLKINGQMINQVIEIAAPDLLFSPLKLKLPTTIQYFKSCN